MHTSSSDAKIIKTDGFFTIFALMAEHNDFGRRAEQAAAEHYIMHGYVLREQNWRPVSSHKEIDIIAERDGVIVFAEVKARTSEDIDPAEAVDAAKIRFLSRAADAYMKTLPFDREYRFDIVCVTPIEGDSLCVEILQDAFMPPLSTR